jgi:hypothetical protein
MQGNRQLQDINLRPVGDHLKEIIQLFEVISFTRVFCELNQEVDWLSKAAQSLATGLIPSRKLRTVFLLCLFQHSRTTYFACFMLI